MSDPEEGEEPADPVKRSLEYDTDLYDIATWEVRGPLDSLSVGLAAALRAIRSALLISIALALFVGQLGLAVLLVGERPALGVLAVASVGPALLVTWYLWWADPTKNEPFGLLAVTFVLSFVFASLAAFLNSVFMPLFGLIPVVGFVLFFFLVVGPVEETVKWLAIRVYAYRSSTFDSVVDGAVYGAVAGLGFAAIENLLYIVQMYAVAGPTGAADPLAAAGQTAVARAFVGPGHVIFSAWAGFYLGLAKFNREHRAPIVVKGLVIAAFIHAVYNTIVSFTAVTATALSFTLFVLVYDGFWFGLLFRKITKYRRLHREAAARSAGDPGSPGE